MLPLQNLISMKMALLWFATLVAFGVLAYWQLVLVEGSYLGPRVVRLIYNQAARRYDRIARYDVDFEDATLGRPLAQRLASDSTVRVLDVATGTGRLPFSLFRQESFTGSLVGLDLSPSMLDRARCNLAAYIGRWELIQHDATTLPFPDESFDAVTCLEALEFLPDQWATLREMVRVLKPGGTLLMSIRIGRRAWAFPGKRLSHKRILDALWDLSMDEIAWTPWEAQYDLIWARRARIGN